MMWSNLTKKKWLDPEDGDEIELAYQLQNLAAYDPLLLKQLIDRYGAELYRWVEVLLYRRLKVDPAREQVLPVLQAVFEYVMVHSEQFRENQSIRDWLFAIGIQKAKQWKVKASSSKQDDWQASQDIGKSTTETPYSRAMDELVRLSESQYKVVVLRYLFQLELGNISQICNSSTKEVHGWLTAGREKLFHYPPSTHLKREVHAYSDGLLDDEPGELERVNQHLAGCNDCQESFSMLDRLEKTFSDELQRRWNLVKLADAEIDQIIESIGREVNQPRSLRRQIFPARQAAWLAGIVTILVAVTVISIRLIPIDDQLTQQAQSTERQSIPPSVAYSGSSIEHIAVEPSRAPLYIAPVFSSDGNWGVFTALTYNSGSRGMIDRSVYIYDRAAGSMQLINQSSGADSTWVWWDLTPSISADGQWIVFVTATNDPEISGIPCETKNDHACMDILLYNRLSGTSRRLTRDYTGGPANGDSLAPTISGDGKWIAFWSTADNLVSGMDNTCHNSANSFTCLNIYIYSMADGKIERIPVQTTAGDSVYGVDRISLSSDGRYIGFTVTSTMQIRGFDPNYLSTIPSYNKSGQQPNFKLRLPQITHTSEAIIYDRETGDYELENKAQDGTFGNGKSSSPVLSGDGRYVAFVSTSTNLVPGDYLGNSDIFVRDRSSGEIQLVSGEPNGNQSNHDSGLTFMESGFFSLNLSEDGRYVVFESLANDLSPSINPDCDNIENIKCVYLYVHDRLTSSTKAISALPNQDFTLLPGVSSDGRWISYMEYSHDCSSTQLRCSNVMLYDQQNGWTSNLTHFGTQAPRLSWKNSGSIALPWQAWESGAIAVSADDSLIALGGIDASVRIWQSDKVTSQSVLGKADYILSLGGTYSFISLAFSNDSSWIAGGTSQGAVYIWNAATQELIYHQEDFADLIRSLVFTPDHSSLIIATSSEVWIWTLANNQLSLVNRENYGSPEAYSVVISPKADLLASAHTDGTIWLQSLPSGEFVDRLGPNLNSIDGMVFSPDGSMLATSQRDGTIDIWQIDQSGTTTSVSPFNHFQSYVSARQLTFSPDNEYLAATGTVGEVPVWSTASGTLFNVAMAIPNEMVYGLVFNKDGKRLVVEFESKIEVWEIPAQQDLNYFSRASMDQFVDSNPFPYGTVNDLPHWQHWMGNFRGLFLDLNQAAKALNFQLVIPGKLPETFTFLSAMVNNDGSVWLRYVANIAEGHQEFIYVYEKDVGNASPPRMVVGAGADVILTQIPSDSGFIQGEYVQGDWLVRRSFTSPSDGSTAGITHYVWYWNPESISEHLRWQQNGMLMGLYYQPYTPYASGNNNYQSFSYLSNYTSSLTETDLEQIASGMIPFHDMSSSSAEPTIP